MTKAPAKKKSLTKQVYSMVFPKSALTEDEVASIKKEFAASGITIVPVRFSDDAIANPRIEKL